jgi:hypothetical protein
MWKEDLHPRNEYGRFRLVGSAGVFDRMAAQASNAAHARAIAEYQHNQDIQHGYWLRREAGQLTAAEDAHWDVLGAQAQTLYDRLPRAYTKLGLQPHDDGTWRDRRQPAVAFDEQGRRLPRAAVLGWHRVGDHPDRDNPRMNGSRWPGDSPLAGGVWHPPGEYEPGRVPTLRNDYGHFIGSLQPDPSPSVRHRRQAGASVRAEDRAGVRSRAGQSTPEVHGGFMLSGLNPTSRRRTARKKRDRQQTVTWIQRLSDRMEGR